MGKRKYPAKSKVIQEFLENRQKILSAINRLPPNQRDTVYLGSWTIKDLIAHLIGWDYTNLEAAKSIQANEPPTFFAEYDRDWQLYNAKLVQQYMQVGFERLIQSALTSLQELLTFLNPLPDEDFTKTVGSRKISISKLLQFETKDEIVHLQQILDYFNIPG